MTRSILRLVLTTLALVLMFAGSYNLNRTSADELEIIEDGGGEFISDCEYYTGCKGGPTQCGTINYPNGGSVKCGMR